MNKKELCHALGYVESIKNDNDRIAAEGGDQ